MTHKLGQDHLAGIALVLVGVGFLTSMDSVAKWLVGADYSVMQILALRGWIIVIGLVFLLPRLGGLKVLKTSRPGGHLFRVIAGFMAPYLFFSSLKTLPLADATVIFFGGATFLMTALSVPVFKEPVGPHRWAAIAVGFVGVLIATHPGSAVFQVESLYALGAGASYALMMVATRWLGSSEGVFRQVFYYNLSLAVIGSTALPAVFVSMPMTDTGILFGMAMLAVGGHYCLTRAFNVAPVGLLAPFEYSSLVWSAAIGYLFWDDIPPPPVLLGAAIIVVSGLYLARRESRLGPADSTPKQASVLIAEPVPVPVVAARVAGADGGRFSRTGTDFTNN